MGLDTIPDDRIKTKIERRKLRDGTINICERLTRYNPEKGYTENLALRVIGKIPPGSEEMIPRAPEKIRQWNWAALGITVPGSEATPSAPSPESAPPSAPAVPKAQLPSRRSAPSPAPASPPPSPDTGSGDSALSLNPMLLAWARELQSLAQAGLCSSPDSDNAGRYQRIRHISAEMLSWDSGLPLSRSRQLFCMEEGYQTPKLDTRAAILQDQRILLVQERSGLWVLPGGWVEPSLSIRENAVRKSLEEAGVHVSADYLIAIQSQNRHNTPASLHSICRVFVACTYLEGIFVPNRETIGSGFFSLQHLPPLSTDKTTPEQLALCFRALQTPHWTPVFD